MKKLPVKKDNYTTDKNVLDAFFARQANEIKQVIRIAILNKKKQWKIYTTNLEETIDFIFVEIYEFFLYKKGMWLVQPLDQIAHIVYFMLYKPNHETHKRLMVMLKGSDGVDEEQLEYTAFETIDEDEELKKKLKC